MLQELLNRACPLAKVRTTGTLEASTASFHSHAEPMCRQGTRSSREVGCSVILGSRQCGPGGSVRSVLRESGQEGLKTEDSAARVSSRAWFELSRVKETTAIQESREVN